MWLQHRLGQSALGNGDDEPVNRPITQRTIEFSPNPNIQSAKLDTITTQSSDLETGLDSGKEGNLSFGSKEIFHAR